MSGSKPLPPAETRASEAAIELCARSLLLRFGVIAHNVLLAERVTVPWRLLLRSLRALELLGRDLGMFKEPETTGEKALDVLQPDAALVGGITGLRRIAATGCRASPPTTAR